MRIISLYQPYATLVVLGLKKFETRHWPTKVRGELGIHASKKMPKWCKELLLQEPFASDLKDVKLPCGSILGTVNLVDCIPSEAWMKKHCRPGKPKEFYYGDYSPDRYAWKLTDPVLFDKPIPAKGSQGFWQFDTELVNSYTGQLSIFDLL
jgi:hypothetical protein